MQGKPNKGDGRRQEPHATLEEHEHVDGKEKARKDRASNNGLVSAGINSSHNIKVIFFRSKIFRWIFYQHACVPIVN
jgi:hypothetical protein